MNVIIKPQFGITGNGALSYSRFSCFTCSTPPFSLPAGANDQDAVALLLAGSEGTQKKTHRLRFETPVRLWLLFVEHQSMDVLDRGALAEAAVKAAYHQQQFLF